MVNCTNVEDIKSFLQGYGENILESLDKSKEDDLAEYFPFQDSGNNQEIKQRMLRECDNFIGLVRSAKIPREGINLIESKRCLDKLAYLITNEDLERNDNLVEKYLPIANRFFTAARAWRRLTALLAGAGKTIKATDVWNTVDPMANISEAVAWLKDYGWKSAWGKILCIYPARVDMGVNQSRTFRGGYDTVAGIIKKSYPEIEFISYAPFRAANEAFEIDILAGTDRDALGTNCIITVAQPARVLECKQCSNVFVKKIATKGYLTTLQRQNACMVKPWKSSSDAATTNPLIVKITGVAAAR